MRLTRRGRLVGAGLVVSFVWGTTFSIQAMNALVLSGVIALLGSWLIVRTADDPTLRRLPVPAGFAGEPREVEIEVSVPSSLGASLVESVPEVVRFSDGNAGRPVENGRVAYTAVADRRGVHHLGPAKIETTDPLGLVADRTVDLEKQPLLTYPEIRPLRALERGRESLLEGMPTRDRHEFDQLREYERGDPVRDIDWKSSAKRAADPLVVKEFVSDSDTGNTMIVATSEPGGTDAMATAAASVAVHFLHHGIAVGIRTSDEHVPVDSGGGHRRAILAALARTDGGRVDAVPDDGAIRIEANGKGRVRVSIGQRERSFDRLTDSRAEPAVTDGGWDS